MTSRLHATRYVPINSHRYNVDGHRILAEILKSSFKNCNRKTRWSQLIQFFLPFFKSICKENFQISLWFSLLKYSNPWNELNKTFYCLSFQEIKQRIHCGKAPDYSISGHANDSQVSVLYRVETLSRVAYS